MLVQALTEEPTLRSVELLHRARQAGYTGGKSAVYALRADAADAGRDAAGALRRAAGEFSQHDFGEVDVRYQDGTEQRRCTSSPRA